MRAITLYGFERVTECEAMLSTRRVNADDAKFDEDDALVESPFDGCWFRTFVAARRALVKELQEQIRVRRELLKFAFSMRRRDVD
jgi:hypothetical protein